MLYMYVYFHLFHSITSHQTITHRTKKKSSTRQLKNTQKITQEKKLRPKRDKIPNHPWLDFVFLCYTHELI